MTSHSSAAIFVVGVQGFELPPGGWQVVVQVVAAAPALLGEERDVAVQVGEEGFGGQLGIGQRSLEISVSNKKKAELIDLVKENI